MGSKVYPRAKSLLIVADSRGSNGSRVRLWKWELQRLSDASQLRVHVCHLPPGTSKWNKIEHRLFSFISRNWRGQPMLTQAIIVKLIAGTRTCTGLKVRCILDRRRYPNKVRISDEQIATTRLTPDSFHGGWNYTILPHKSRSASLRYSRAHSVAGRAKEILSILVDGKVSASDRCSLFTGMSEYHPVPDRFL